LDRHGLLKLSVQKAGYKVYQGVGCDPSGEWPSEISLAKFAPLHVGAIWLLPRSLDPSEP